VRDFDTAESANRFFFLTDAQFSVLATLRQTGEIGVSIATGTNSLPLCRVFIISYAGLRRARRAVE